MNHENKNINTISSKMETKITIKKRGKKIKEIIPEQIPIEKSVIVFKNTKEKGDAYEIFIKHELIDSGEYEWVYLWKDLPESELFESGIMDDWNLSRVKRKEWRTTGILPDFGTDLMIKGNDGKYSIVQCKYYDENNMLRIEDLGTFYFMMFNYFNYVNGIVYHTSKLTISLEKHFHHAIKYNHLAFNPSRYLELLNTIYKPKLNDSSNTKLIPYDYQLEAIEKLRGKQRTVCQLPCGMGKTLIAIKLAEQYNQVIVITLLKIYCEQNLERFKSQISNDYSMMIIDSDNDGRNLDKIKTFITDNPKICLFVTFKSVDIVNKLINEKIVSNYYVIIDEFHNLSVSDILEDDLEEDELLEEVNQELDPELEDSEEDTENDDTEDIEDDSGEDEDIEEPENNKTEMYKLLHSNSRILFMSATPKLMGSDRDYSEDCDIDEEIFGQIDYKMDMRTAIERNGICDYIVYVPTLSIEKSVGLDKIQEEVDISKYDKELVIKARFIIRGMMNNGSWKCIIYLQTQEECRVMNTILADIGKNYFAVDINSNYIISDSSREERNAVIKAFTDCEGYSFLCNVNILNECIDIPECDSIFIAYPSKSKIRNIQRMCRANRKDKKNLNKIARIYIWADEYKDELVDFIGHLKEYDSKFEFAKVKRLNVIGNKTAVMESSDAVEENKKLEDVIVGITPLDI
jgi:superfamily II DNA or RNA helicase